MWLGGVVIIELVIKRSWVRLPTVSLSGSNSGQVVLTHVPLCLVQVV